MSKKNIPKGNIYVPLLSYLLKSNELMKYDVFSLPYKCQKYVSATDKVREEIKEAQLLYDSRIWFENKDPSHHY